MGKHKKQKERQKYPWVLPKGKKLPKMTTSPQEKYHLPLRTPKVKDFMRTCAISTRTLTHCAHKKG